MSQTDSKAPTLTSSGPPTPAALWGRDLAAGTLSGFVGFASTISYGVLIFGVPALAPHLATGFHTILLASCILCLVVALGSSSPFSIAGPTPKPTAIVALMAASLSRDLVAAEVPPEQILITVLMMLSVSAILTGLFLYLLGAWRCGRLLSFVPYSVVAGFMASTGFLLIRGGLEVLLKEPPTLQMLRHPPEVAGPALLSAAAVLLGVPLAKRFIHPALGMPIGLILGSVVFFVSLQSFGMTPDAAREQGLLFKLPRLVESGVHLPTLDGVRTDLLMKQWQNLLALALVVVFSIMFTSMGMDVATEQDVDFDREMQVNGLANVLAGLAGGIVGCVSTTRSLLHHKAGAVTRKAGVWCAVLILIATLFLLPYAEYLPKPVLVGLLLFLGMDMLHAWMWKSYRQLSHFEFALLMGILVLVAVQGLVVGVVFGLMVALVYFVYSYSQTNCIRYNFTVADRASNKERALEIAGALKKHGRQARVFSLQGYVFFALASRILAEARMRIETEKLRYLMLDFRLVQGLDVSSVISLCKLEKACERNGAELALCGVKPDMDALLKQGGLLPNPRIMQFADMDRGLEYFEEKILADPSTQGDAVPTSTRGVIDAAGTMTFMSMDDVMRGLLAPHFTESSLDIILARMEPQALQEDELLFKQGDPGDDMFFIERGEVTVRLKLDDRVVRLRTFGPGSVVGEMALYSHLPRSAECVADSPCRVQRFRYKTLLDLEKTEPQAAMEFHRYIIKLLSQRIIVANDQIRVLF